MSMTKNILLGNLITATLVSLITLVGFSLYWGFRYLYESGGWAGIMGGFLALFCVIFGTIMGINKTIEDKKNELKKARIDEDHYER